MAIRNKTTNLYTEWLPLINNLSNEEAGVLIKNILKYQNGEEINCNNPIWIFIKSKIDDYNNNLLEIRKTRVEAGKLGGLAKASKCQHELAKPSKLSNKTKQNKTKENKDIYGSFKNVLLTKEEFIKLQEIYSNKLNEAIEFLSSCIASKGYNYTSHYAVMGKTQWVYRKIMEDNKPLTNQKTIY